MCRALQSADARFMKSMLYICWKRLPPDAGFLYPLPTVSMCRPLRAACSATAMLALYSRWLLILHLALSVGKTGL